MIKLIILLSLLSLCLAQPSIVFNRSGEVWEEQGQSGMTQLYDLMDQLSASMSTLPPVVERIAFYQIRIDKNDFNPGISKYIQGMIETIFLEKGRKAVIVSPDLKTTKIVITDTSLSMSNALPDAEALWSLGRKLRVDAFIQGSVSRSDDDDLLLHLNLIRQETAEVLWSVNFIAGPNKKKARPFDLEYTLSMGFGYWPASKFKTNDNSISADLALYRYFGEFGVLQSVGGARRLLLNLIIGAGALTPVPEDPDDLRYDNFGTKFEVHTGLDMIVVLVPKRNPLWGHWLSMYLGSRAIFPNSLIAIRAGYMTRMTPNLGFSLGAQYFPLNKTIKSGLLGLTDNSLKMKALLYEAQIFYHF
jgi:hypothetical protein